MHYRVAGTVTGTGVVGEDDTTTTLTDDPTDNALLIAGDVTLTGTAQFAVSKWDRDLGTVTGGTLNSYAFNVNGAGLLVGDHAAPDLTLTLSGALAVAAVNDSADATIYTAIKMGDVDVTLGAYSPSF